MVGQELPAHASTAADPLRMRPDLLRNDRVGQPEHRCLVPATSFAEPDNNQGPKSIWTWFAQDETRPLMFFAGIWREWEGDRGTKATPDVGKHLVVSFLT